MELRALPREEREGTEAQHGDPGRNSPGNQTNGWSEIHLTYVGSNCPQFTGSMTKASEYESGEVPHRRA